MPGFDTGSVMFALNVDFTGNSLTEGTAQVTTDGQLLIGSSVAPNIRIGTLGSSDGSITWTVGNGTISGQVAGGTTVGRTITGNTGGPVSPTAGNWNIIGAGETANNGTPGTSTLSILSPRVAKFVVDPTPNFGTHTSISSAIAAAISGQTIFVRPGTYTENITLQAGINLSAFACDAQTPNVTIIGKLTATYAGTVSISGIRLQTNSDNFLTSTGTNAAILNLIDCYLNCSTTTGILLNNVNCQLYCYGCNGNIGTTGIGLHTLTACVTAQFKDCSISNTGGSSTASTIAAGTLNYANSAINHITTTSSGGAFSFVTSTINTSATNTTSFTTAGTGISTLYNCFIASGSASSISVGAGSEVDITQSQVSSTNTNAITGAGTLRFGDVTFISSSSTINTTTQVVYPHLNGSFATPVAGFIGERIASAIAQGSAITLSTGASKTITSVSLTAGVWDISIIAQFSGATTGTALTAAMSLTTDSLSGTVAGDTSVQKSFTTQASADDILVIPAVRSTVASTTTHYMVVNETFTVGTGKAYGRISAVRVG